MSEPHTKELNGGFLYTHTHTHTHITFVIHTHLWDCNLTQLQTISETFTLQANYQHPIELQSNIYLPMAEDRLEGLTGGFVPTTPCPLLIRPVRPLPNGRIPPLHEDQNQYPLLKDTLASFPGPSPPLPRRGLVHTACTCTKYFP